MIDLARWFLYIMAALAAWLAFVFGGGDVTQEQIDSAYPVPVIYYATPETGELQQWIADDIEPVNYAAPKELPTPASP